LLLAHKLMMFTVWHSS